MNKSFLIFLCLGFLVSSCASTEKISKLKAGSAKHAVVSYHPIATQVGEKILSQGGNAFDAFVAVTCAEYVLGEGVTSIGGPLGALLYSAKSKTSYFLDAGFNDPLSALPISAKPQPGEAALVPGAIAGLEAIAKNYGKLGFKKDLDPAIQLARDGFVLNRLYANILANPIYQTILQRTDYGKQTFCPNGHALKEGDRLKLPTLADFLSHLAEQGSSYAYQGDWAKRFVATIARAGGHLTAKDLSDYKVIWWMPSHGHYRDVDIFSTSGRAYGGLNALLALEVLDRSDLKEFGPHYSTSADGLELLIRIENEVKNEAWLRDPAALDNLKKLEAGLSDDNAEAIWKRVQKKMKDKSPLLTSPAEGSHSYQVVVIDDEGNAVTGTNTIESTPFAQGLFVDGVALTAARTLKYFRTSPGERRLSGLSMQIGMKDDKVLFASGAFGSSLIPASFQFIVNIIDYKMSARDALNTPRFGDDAWNMNMLSYKSLSAIWLDPKVDKKIIATLSQRNIKLTQDGLVDTGLGALALVDASGRVSRAIANPQNYAKPQKK